MANRTNETKKLYLISKNTRESPKSVFARVPDLLSGGHQTQTKIVFDSPSLCVDYQSFSVIKDYLTIGFQNAG